MACVMEWSAVVSSWLAMAASGVGIVGSGIMEAGSFGALTPAAAATLIGSILFLLSAIAADIAASIALANCLEAQGKHDAAAKIRERVNGLQAEHDRLTNLVERLKAAVAV